MLLRMSDWDLVREKFDESEKVILNQAIDGETICPRGVTVNEQKAGSVGVKLKNLVRGLHE